jgi:hypothetical protein
MAKAFREIEPGKCRSLGNEPQMSENRRTIVVSICAQGVTGFLHASQQARRE